MFEDIQNDIIESQDDERSKPAYLNPDWLDLDNWSDSDIASKGHKINFIKIGMVGHERDHSYYVKYDVPENVADVDGQKISQRDRQLQVIRKKRYYLTRPEHTLNGIKIFLRSLPEKYETIQVSELETINLSNNKICRFEEKSVVNGTKFKALRLVSVDGLNVEFISNEDVRNAVGDLYFNFCMIPRQRGFQQLPECNTTLEDIRNLQDDIGND